MIKLFGGWLILIVFNVLGAGLIYAAVTQYSTASRAKDWPNVQGTVLSSEVVREEPEYQNRERGEGTRYVYYPDIQYEYFVGGVRYQNDRITVEDFGRGKPGHAERTTELYPTGQEVTVYYHPDDPAKALLQPGKGGGTFSTLIIGLAFMIVPTGMVILLVGRDLFPELLRLWWSMKFGKLSKIKE